MFVTQKLVDFYTQKMQLILNIWYTPTGMSSSNGIVPVYDISGAVFAAEEFQRKYQFVRIHRDGLANYLKKEGAQLTIC